MAVLPLILGPDPVLRAKASAVSSITAEILSHIQDMFDTLYERRAVGIGANMVGILKRIIVIDLQENGNKRPLACVNPVITWQSETITSDEEASLCFPGISAEVSRPDAVHLSFLDENGDEQKLEAEGWLAKVIQHEIDYLDGKTYLDYLSKMKRDRLLKKMQKQLKSTSCDDPHCCPQN